MISLLADAVVPAGCAGCGLPVSWNLRGLCADCLGGCLPHEDACGRCGGEIGNCYCHDRRFYPERVVTVYDYEGKVKDIIKGIKKGEGRGAAGVVTRKAWEERGHLIPEFDLVCSIPASRKGRWTRGYDQGELIARTISSLTGKPYRELIRQRKGAATHKTLHLLDRYVMTLESFYTVNNKAFTGRSILLVDDVITSGASLNEAARMLLESGAKAVFSFILARSRIKKLENYDKL